MASALSALAGTLRGKFSNRQGHSKGAFPLTSKRGPRDFYKGKGAKSTGTLTKKGACTSACVCLRRGVLARPCFSTPCTAWGELFALSYGHCKRVWADGASSSAGQSREFRAACSADVQIRGHELQKQRQTWRASVCTYLCNTVLRCRAWRVRSHRNVGRRHLCCAAPQARGVCCARSGRM
jgi:hypothetical protein